MIIVLIENFIISFEINVKFPLILMTFLVNSVKKNYLIHDRKTHRQLNIPSNYKTADFGNHGNEASTVIVFSLISHKL